MCKFNPNLPMAEHVLLLTAGFMVPYSMTGSWWKMSDAVPHASPRYLSASIKIDQIPFATIFGAECQENNSRCCKVS